MTATMATNGIDMVAAMSDTMLAEANACETARTMTSPVVDAMWSTGLMHRFNPVEAGGAEPSFTEMIETWIEMARLDGSFGWIGIANLPSAAAVAAYLPPDGFTEVFGGADHHTTVGGQFAPNGTGRAVDGGVVLTGSWNFGSGTGHSEYVAAGYLPLVDGEMVWVTPEMPLLRVAVIPRGQITFTDGWHVQGLKGTGSYDYNVHELFVPEYRTFDLFCRTPQRGSSPAFHMGLMPLTAAGHAAWALGVAGSMLDDVAALAQTKVRMGDMATLANKPSFQQGYAHHRAMWRATRLLVLDAWSSAEQAVAAGDELTPTMRADLRAAAVYATESSREIAEWAHLAAGTAAIREGNRLERAFRDLYTGTQHAFINERIAVHAGQVMLGVVDDHIGL